MKTVYYTDDPIQDAERYGADQDKFLSSLPVCGDCGEHIQTEDAYYIDVWICNDCIDCYKRPVLPD